MTADKPDEPAGETKASGIATGLFLQVEHWVYSALGVLLALIAVVTLVHGAIDAGTAILKWNSEDVFGVIDDLLFVLMLVEILHTVRVSIQSGALNAEPFLIVGLIASIRRVLVITLESSGTTKNTDWTPAMAGLFHASMLELGVLSVLILVMVVSIYLIRRTEFPSSRPGRKRLVDHLGDPV